MFITEKRFVSFYSLLCTSRARQRRSILANSLKFTRIFDKNLPKHNREDFKPKNTFENILFCPQTSRRDIISHLSLSFLCGVRGEREEKDQEELQVVISPFSSSLSL